MGHFIPNRTTEVSGDIADMLHAVTRRIRRDAVADLAPIGLTPALVRTLRTLRRYDGSARMSSLAEALHIARRSATTLVDGLAARGLVAREDDPSDRRAVLVRLTDRGVALLDEIDALRRAAAERMLRTLSAGDQDQLRDLLTHLLQA
jgi:DNA-binding MarR family transcriptional regulator